MSSEEFLILVAVIVVVIALMTQRWFWLIGLFLGGLASAFTVLASVIYFQILYAVLFFIISAICWTIFVLILEGED